MLDVLPVPCYGPSMRVFRLIGTAVLTILLVGILPAQETPSAARTAYENGLRALSDNLPQLAVTRFRNALEETAPDDPLVPQVQLRLGEALVRSGSPADALEVLSGLPDDPVATYWTAHSHLLAGRLSEAESVFARLAGEDAGDLREPSLLIRARILASLGNQAALATILDELDQSPNPATVSTSHLIRAASLLSQGEVEEAGSTLAATDPATPGQESLHNYLAARAALDQGDPGEAAALLKNLLPGSEGRSRPLMHAASIAYADALHQAGESDAAIDFLIDYLTRNPGSPDAAACFDRLTDWSRGVDALRELVDNRLLEWTKRPTYGFLQAREDPIAESVSSQSAQPPSPLAPPALLYRARHLAERNDEKSVRQAKRLLARLRTETTDPSLVAESLLETSRLHLATQNQEAALSALRALELCAPSQGLRTRAAELIGVVRYESADYEKAADAFERVGDYLGARAEASDQLNLGLSLLMTGAGEEFEGLVSSLKSGALREALELERLLLQASELKPEARDGLDAFLRAHPRNRRTAEARLALAELSVLYEPRDLTMAEAQLQSIDPSALGDRALVLRHLLASLSLADSTGEWDIAIASGNAYLLNFPKSPLSPMVRLKLAQAYFLNSDFNKAQRIFQQLAADEEAARYREVALFFAARSALRVLTPEAREEAISLLEEVLAEEGPLAGEARLLLVRAQLDAGAPREALDTLAPLLSAEMPMGERLDALVLQAEAYRALGTSAGDEKAVAILDDCLAWEGLRYADSNRLHYLKALTLEQLGRDEEALDTLYRVVNFENLPAGESISEWTHFYDCGFKAVRLLGERDDWKGAYAIARKLASSGGPRSNEAAKRARAIQLEHMIWDEEQPPATP